MAARMIQWLVAFAAMMVLYVVGIPAYAWWAIPHMIIGEIADDYIKDPTRERSILVFDSFEGFFPKFDNFGTASVWADNLKGHGVESFNSWHFTNIPIVGPGMPKDFKPPPIPAENVVWAINQCKDVLTSKNGRIWGRSLFLRFLLHFVGDIHQPLHCTDRYTVQHPDGDFGGNAFKLTDPNDTRVHNLHEFWDSAGGLFVDAPRNELSPEAVTYVKNRAKALAKEHPRSSFPDNLLDDLDVEHWANGSFTIARDFAYKGVEPNKPVTQAYRDEVMKICSRRIALAGYRLAETLNHVLPTNSGPEKPGSAPSSGHELTPLETALIAGNIAMVLLAVLFGYLWYWGVKRAGDETYKRLNSNAGSRRTSYSSNTGHDGRGAQNI